MNIWNIEGSWSDRCAVIAREAAAIAPDILALQEVVIPGYVEPDQATTLAAQLGWNKTLGQSTKNVTGLGLGNAVLSPHPVTHKQTFPLPSNLRSRSKRRTLLWSTVSLPELDVHVVVTHLAWAPEDDALRTRQIRSVLRFIDERIPPEVPLVLMGDFNAEPGSEAVQTVLGAKGFVDCWTAASPDDRGWTMDPRVNPHAAERHKQPRRIDYIFVRHPNIEISSASTAFREPIDGVWASDHFGVVAEVCITS